MTNFLVAGATLLESAWPFGHKAMATDNGRFRLKTRHSPMI